MRRIVLGYMLGIFTALAVPGGTIPLDEQAVNIRWAIWRYPCDEALFRAVLTLENGARGHEAGYNRFWLYSTRDGDAGDVRSWSDPTMPEAALQHARLARRLSRKAQEWILQNPTRRAAFMRWWAAGYLSGGEEAPEEKRREANRDYANKLASIYEEQVRYLKQRARDGGYNPVLLSEEQTEKKTP